MTARIPSSITHDEFNAAMKPLLDLLGTSGNEIVGDFNIVATGAKDAINSHEIRFAVVAPPADVPRQEFPDAVLADSHPQDNEFAIWTHRINVGVLG